MISVILFSKEILNATLRYGQSLFGEKIRVNVSSLYDEMNDALTYAEGYFQILDADDQIETRGNLGVCTLHGNFELIDVSFTYPNGTAALHHINMKIPHGKTVAFVGLSGAGKSTLLNLLTRFYEPTSGKIFLDGKELTEYKTDLLRANIGLVLQKNHIFNGTIEETSATARLRHLLEVQEAARKAFLNEQIEQLPRKYQAEAHLLSGGQQQRIAIARLFLKNPPIIFLDEPTASLDAIATEQIKNSLDAIKEDCT